MNNILKAAEVTPAKTIFTRHHQASEMVTQDKVKMQVDLT